MHETKSARWVTGQRRTRCSTPSPRSPKPWRAVGGPRSSTCSRRANVPSSRLADEIGQSVANTSHHLRAMARAGVLRTRREGTRIFYMLASDRVGDLWAALRDVAAEHVAGIDRLAEAYLGDRSGLEPVTRRELEARLKAGDTVVLDVRPSAEFEAGHIAGARSVPVGELRRLAIAVQGHRGRRLLPRPVLRVRRRGRAPTPPTRLRRPPSRRRIPRMETSRPARRGRSRRMTMPNELLVDVDTLARPGTRQVPRGRHRPARHPPLPHRPPARRPPRLRPDGRRRRCRIGPSSPSPVSATRSRCAASNPASGSSTSAPAPGSTPSSPPHQVGPTGRVVGVDMTPEMLAKSRATAGQLGLRPRRVPRRARRSAAGRGRLGRRRHLQRRDQPVRRQASRVRRDPPGAAPGRRAAVRRHRQRPTGPDRGDARRRPVDRLNCRRAAPCGLATDARRLRVRRRRRSVHRSTPSAAPSAKPTPARSRSTATPSSPTGPNQSIKPERRLQWQLTTRS